MSDLFIPQISLISLRLFDKIILAYGLIKFGPKCVLSLISPQMEMKYDKLVGWNSKPRKENWENHHHQLTLRD